MSNDLTFNDKTIAAKFEDTLRKFSADIELNYKHQIEIVPDPSEQKIRLEITNKNELMEFEENLLLINALKKYELEQEF